MSEFRGPAARRQRARPPVRAFQAWGRMVPVVPNSERFGRSLSPSWRGRSRWAGGIGSKKERGMHASLIRVARSVLLTRAATLSAGRAGRGQGAGRPEHAQPAAPRRIQPGVRTPRRRHRLRPGVQRSAVIDEPGGLICDGDQIYESWTSVCRGQADLRRGRQPAQAPVPGGFRRQLTNPSSGVTVELVTHATNIHVLSVPGDLASGISSGAGTGRSGSRARRRHGPDRRRSIGVRRRDGASSSPTVRITSTTTSSEVTSTRCSRSATRLPDRDLPVERA